MDVHEGDIIEIHSTKVDRPSRRGRVLEVTDQDPLTLQVAWDDGHHSTLRPAGGMVSVVERER